jgi:hypothetical protein
MTVFVQLTTIGTDCGPFAIYSNLSYSSPVTSATVEELQSGISVDVPDPATSVRVVSLGNCTNSIDIPIAQGPTLCNEFYAQATVSTIVTYKDCETGDINQEPLDAGDSITFCAYIDGPYPYFTKDTEGVIKNMGACGAGRPGCTQTTLFANVGGGGAVFRIFECEADQSILVTLAAGATSNRCVRNDIDIQLVSGVGSFTQGSACTV